MEKKNYEVYTKARAEIIVKKSKFIGETFSVKSEEEALYLVNATKKKYYDARHHCYAYSLWDENAIRCSDDGEPSGTAGRPILDVILGAGMLNTLIIVTRYFGGTLLGTGGLTRAYKDAAKIALANTTKLERRQGVLATVELSYDLLGKAENILRNSEATLLDNEYKANVILRFLASKEQTDRILTLISEISAGSIKPEISETKNYGIVDNRVIWL